MPSIARARRMEPVANGGAQGAARRFFSAPRLLSRAPSLARGPRAGPADRWLGSPSVAVGRAWARAPAEDRAGPSPGARARARTPPAPAPPGARSLAGAALPLQCHAVGWAAAIDPDRGARVTCVGMRAARAGRWPPHRAGTLSPTVAARRERTGWAPASGRGSRAGRGLTARPCEPAGRPTAAAHSPRPFPPPLPARPAGRSALAPARPPHRASPPHHGFLCRIGARRPSRRAPAALRPRARAARHRGRVWCILHRWGGGGWRRRLGVQIPERRRRPAAARPPPSQPPTPPHTTPPTPKLLPRAPRSPSAPSRT